MDKLYKVLRVRRQKEQDSAQVLSHSQSMRENAESQRQQLDDLAAEYRRMHAGVEQGNVQQFRAFQRFYAQLKAAVGAQQEVLARSVQAEDQAKEAFVATHVERRALEKLLEQRDAVRKTKQERAARRGATAPRRNPMV